MNIRNSPLPSEIERIAAKAEIDNTLLTKDNRRILYHVFMQLTETHRTVLLELIAGSRLKDCEKLFTGKKNERIRQLGEEAIFSIRQCLLSEKLQSFRDAVLAGKTKTPLPLPAKCNFAEISYGRNITDEQEQRILACSERTIAIISRATRIRREAVSFVLKQNDRDAAALRKIFKQKICDAYEEFHAIVSDAAVFLGCDRRTISLTWKAAGKKIRPGGYRGHSRQTVKISELVSTNAT